MKDKNIIIICVTVIISIAMICGTILLLHYQIGADTNNSTDSNTTINTTLNETQYPY